MKRKHKYSRTLAKDHLDQETILQLRPLFTSPVQFFLYEPIQLGIVLLHLDIKTTFAIKITFAYSHRWSLYKGSTIYLSYPYFYYHTPQKCGHSTVLNDHTYVIGVDLPIQKAQLSIVKGPILNGQIHPNYVTHPLRNLHYHCDNWQASCKNVEYIKDTCQLLTCLDRPSCLELILIVYSLFTRLASYEEKQQKSATSGHPGL